jgi:tetratricopeptide (TPR) repeat protein
LTTTIETLSGVHDRSEYVRLVSLLMRGGHDGLLTISFGQHERQIGFLQGCPVYYASNVAEDDLSRTLVQSKLIPRKRMDWIEKKLGPEESLEDAVIFTGTLEPDALNSHLEDRLGTTLGSPMRWGTGKWTFQPLAEFDPSTIDATLLPSLDGVKALWQGVLQQVSVEEAFPVVTSEESVPYQAHRDLDEWLDALALEGPVSAISSELKAGRTITEIFEILPDDTGTLPRLLWFLEVGGLVQRQGSAASLEAAKLVGRLVQSATPETLAAVLEAQAERLENGADGGGAAGAVQRAELTDEERELLEMGGSVFKEAEEEDEDASFLRGGEKKKNQPTASYASARSLVEEGDYKGALPLLEKARFECPTSPDVLADLAWCTWRTRDFNPTAQHEAEEFLRLALSFDGRHLPTLEYQARVALEMEDHDAAVQALKRLLNVEPGHEWATRFLEEQNETQGKGIFSLFKGRST